jgi:hypothetical protein
VTLAAPLAIALAALAGCGGACVDSGMLESDLCFEYTGRESGALCASD